MYGMMPGPYRRRLRESNLFLAAGCCRSQDLHHRRRNSANFIFAPFVTESFTRHYYLFCRYPSGPYPCPFDES